MQKVLVFAEIKDSRLVTVIRDRSETRYRAHRQMTALKALHAAHAAELRRVQGGKAESERRHRQELNRFKHNESVANSSSAAVRSPCIRTVYLPG